MIESILIITAIVLAIVGWLVYYGRTVGFKHLRHDPEQGKRSGLD